MRRLALALLAVAVAGGCSCQSVETCKAGQTTGAQPLTPTPDAGLLAYAHAHNDYEHPRPLEDALAAGFHSVEADVYYADGRFDVRHGALDGAKGTLEGLYLAPLQEKVTARGSVLGDGERFTLWIDFKDSDSRITEALRTLLAKYPMLSRADEAGITEGPVTIALTGDAGAKGRYADSPAPRFAFRDSNDFHPEDPPADLRWRYYALSWGTYVPWNGDGAPSAEAERRLGCLAANAHASGRKLRLYGAPDKPAVWEQQVRFGVDFIGTDKLEALSALLAGK